MKRLFAGLILSILVITIFPGPLAAAEDAATLVSFKGTVMISENGKDGWMPVKLGMSVPEGYYIRSGKNSEAALMLKDRSQIRLRHNSVLQLKKSGSAPAAPKQKKGVLSFLKGELWMRNKRKVIKPDINTASLNMSIRGTELKLVVTEDNETRVTALEGDILAANETGSTVIKRGLEAISRDGGPIETVTVVNPEGSVQWLLITPDVVGPKDRAPAAPDARMAVDLSRLAMGLLVENKTQAALEKAKEALQVMPDNASANVAMATILQTMGQFDPALGHARKGLAADPLSEPALLRSVELMLGLNQVAAAQNLMAGFHGEKTARSRMVEGFIHLIKQDLALAEKAFETAVSMDRELARAWLGLGLSLYAQGRVPEGLDKMETASLMNPLSAFPHNYLGKALFENEEYEEAEVEFIRAQQLDPNDPTPHLYMAIMAQDRFRPAKSIRHLNTAIEMNDNLFVSRSRFLLDSDRSVKNINLAAALSALGLNEWARHMGNKAVWEDPANSSAYLFRGSEAISLSRVDVSTLSDLKRAQLLKPVNSNTFPSYTDYNSLIDLPEHMAIAEAYAGTDETYGGTLTLRGGTNRHSYLVSGHTDTTDGPDNHTGSSARYVDVQYKTEPVFNHQFVLGVLGGEDDQEDARPLQNGFAEPNDDDTETDYYQINGGYHWRVSSGQDLLVSLSFQKRDSDALQNRFFEFVPNIYYNWKDLLYQDDERWRAEAIDIIRYNNHAFTFGGSASRLERTLDNNQSILGSGTVLANYNAPTDEPDESELRLFARDLWGITDDLTLDLGAGWCRYDADNKDDVSRFLPQVGAMFDIAGDNLLRAAWFKEIQPDYLSATLQPVETAGFQSVTGVPAGTLTETVGLAFDRQWSSRYFASIDALYTRKKYNSPYSPHPDLAGAWTEQDTKSLGLTLDYLISDCYAVSLTQRFTKVEPNTPGLNRQDSETGIRFTCAWPFGLTLQTAWWMVDQEFDDPAAAGIDGDHFVIGSVSARQSLWNKKLELFLNIDNILDQSYSYSPEESIAGLDLPWQGIFVLAGFRIKF